MSALVVYLWLGFFVLLYFIKEWLDSHFKIKRVSIWSWETSIALPSIDLRQRIERFRLKRIGALNE